MTTALRRHPLGVVILFLSLVLSSCALIQHERPVSHRSSRLFQFIYRAELPPIPAGEGPIDLFVPLADENPDQQILKRDIMASIPGTVRHEAGHGNRFWHGHVERSDGRPIEIEVDYEARRWVVTPPVPGRTDHPPRAILARYLQPDRRGPVADPLIDAIRNDLQLGELSPEKKLRMIYDYVVDTMEYKKVGSGWGQGDTLWACSQRYGNCTDFHALVTSLARAEGIPVRFEIGFPIPEGVPNGEISGYHCWLKAYLPGKGWFPLDASEAKKHPERRELYFGSQPADRILFTVGRDLRLSKAQANEPLNFFIYPHLEVAGRQVNGISYQFRYVELTDTPS